MFIDTEDFPFVEKLESNWEEIRDESLSLPENIFEPWVQREMYDKGWSVYGFYAFGKKIEKALDKCPKTADLLSKIPNLTTAGFSRLAPGTHIKPHVGWVTTVFRLHLGLIVPNGCQIRVGDETKNWEEGKALIFDDTVEHEAWNNSNKNRTVLLLDFARPGKEHFIQDVPPPEVRSFMEKK